MNQTSMSAGIDQRSDKAINMSIKLVQKLYILDSELYLNSNDDVTPPVPPMCNELWEAEVKEPIGL